MSDSPSPPLILRKDIALPEGVKTSDVSDGYHTFGELYEHRIRNFIALMHLAKILQFPDCGWSRRHSDGELCFGGGWVLAWITVPNSGGMQARYHMEDTRPLPPDMEKPLAPPWNGKEETLEALSKLVSLANYLSPFARFGDSL